MLFRSGPVRTIKGDVRQLGAQRGEEMRVGVRHIEVGEGVEDRNAVRVEAAAQIAKEIPGDQVFRRAVAVEQIDHDEVVAPAAVAQISARILQMDPRARRVEAEEALRRRERRRIDFDRFDLDALLAAARAVTTIFLGLTAVSILRYVLNRDPIVLNKIFAAICVYLLFGLTMASVYGLIEQFQPGAFAVGGQPLTTLVDGTTVQVELSVLAYFSLVTLTTP